jgi:hypothetical protein
MMIMPEKKPSRDDKHGKYYLISEVHASFSPQKYRQFQPYGTIVRHKPAMTIFNRE